MTYRVVHCGTGNVGKGALRAIVGHPDLELVGHYVNTPEKAGRDSGELVGLPPTGVITTNGWDEVLDLEADCLSYFGDSIGREREAVLDLVPFLERGTNCVSISTFAIAHPPSTPPDLREPLEAACKKGNSSAFFTGSDPGWATTDLAIASLASAYKVDCIRVMELGWWGSYNAEYVCREYFGFGKPPGFKPLLVTGGFIEHMWEPTLRHLAEVLGVEIEDFNVLYDTAALGHDVETAFGTVEAGTASAVRFEYQALNGGTPFAVVEHVDLVAREVGEQWKQPFGPGDFAFRIEIEGDPTFTVEMNFDNVPGYTSVGAAPAINAIPALCRGPAGICGPLDIDRYWTRNATARRK